MGKSRAQPQQVREPYNITEPPEHPVVLIIPLDQILPDPHQPREKIDDIRDLACSIKNQGLQQLPEVNFGFVKEGKTYFYLKAGERRYHAHQLLGCDEMECTVRDSYDGVRSVSRRLAQGAENSSRKPHTHTEMIKLVEDVISDEVGCGPRHGAVKRGLARVANAFGKSTAWAQSYHVLAGLVPELRIMLDEDDKGEKLNMRVALTLASAPKDKQKELLEGAEPLFKKGGHRAGYAFIATNARRLRQERGEKVRGRGYDEKQIFMRAASILFKQAEGFGGLRRGPELHSYIEEQLSRMSKPEVDEMLNNLDSALSHFSMVRDHVRERRNKLYEDMRGVRKKEAVSA